ncbi:hypothetical protein Leryth_003036 [Lithospermum erythrorhizon]|nr:hypothetical protein Leryth_003036 [Lithospermum erythrorhizon]
MYKYMQLNGSSKSVKPYTNLRRLARGSNGSSISWRYKLLHCCQKEMVLQFFKMENNDLWLALDKLYHVLFGFILTMLFSLVATQLRHPYIRRKNIWIGCILSFLGGIAKEVADEFGYFNSAGASFKDFLADLFGTLLAAITISLFKPAPFWPRLNPYDQAEKALEMV